MQEERDYYLSKGGSVRTFKSKITKKFTDACKKIGIYIPKKTTLHCLRHTFAVKKYLETRDIYEVCKRLNHDKLSTTMIYTKFSFERLEQDFPTLMENTRVRFEQDQVSKMDDIETHNIETPINNNYISPRQID